MTPHPHVLHLSKVARRRLLFGGAGLVALLAMPTARPDAQSAAGTEDVTYILPVYEQYAQVSDATFAAEVAKLRNRLGPEGPNIRLGFTTYLPIILNDWSVDPSNPVAIRAAMQGTIDLIDRYVTRARANNIPLCLSFLTAIRSGYDPVQTGAERADVRNTQWFGGQDQGADNTISSGWMTTSRYARRYEAVQEAYLRELGKVIANRMQLYPETLVASAGDGEVELSYEKTPIVNSQYTTDTMLLADYSPFAILEFRDWLTASGLYASGQPYDGQAYENASRYANNLTRLNQDFGTSFTNFSLRYFDWSLGNEAGSAIPLSQYTSGLNRHPSSNPGGFDAPRQRSWNSAWWQVWLQFRRQMVLRHNIDFSKWITTSADSGPGSGGTGATVPTSRWYAYQIPADRLYGLTPDDPNNLRYETSASAWWTADVSPYGRVGLTAFNLFIPGICGSADVRINFFCRTLASVAPQIAQRNVRFGLIEWHPGVGNQGQFPVGSDVYGEEMKLVEQYRPALLAPYALYTMDPSDPSRLDPEKPFYGSGFETALKALVARLNNGGPLILSQPASQSTAAGQTVTFAVSASGSALTYRWQQSTDNGGSWTNVSDGAPYSGTGTATLTIAGVATSLSGRQYRVILTNSVGTATSNAATLTVVGAPAITTHPVGQTITPGQTATFTVVATGTPTPSYQWQVSSNNGAAWTNVSNGSPYTGADTPALSVVGAASLNGAQYRVVVTNAGGSATSSVAALTVNGAPAVTTHPSNIAVNEGQNVSFSVTATGTPPPTYQWQRSMDGSPWTTLTNGAPYGGATTATLTIAAAPSALNGMRFRAIAVNTAGFATSNAATLTVNGATNPQIAIEAPADSAVVPTSFAMSGWAFDRGAGIGTGVDVIHVYAYPIVDGALGSAIWIGQASYGAARPDIGSTYGSQFSGTGFSITVSLTPGTYRLVAYAHSRIAGAFNAHRSVDVSVRAPISNAAMALDTPSQGSTRTSTFTTAGWAVDRGAAAGTGVDAIHVYAFPIVAGGFGTPVFVGQATYGAPRGDVGAVFGTQFTTSGFTLAANLAPGTYRVIAYAHSTVTGTFNNAQSADITIQAAVSLPAMALDGPSNDTTVHQPFLAGGWAADLGAESGTGIDAIHVWAFRVSDGAPFFVAQGTSGGARPDVGAVFGGQFANSGYTFVVQGLAPGEYDLGAYARSTVSGTFNQVRFARITIR